VAKEITSQAISQDIPIQTPELLHQPSQREWMNETVRTNLMANDSEI
jgi:hypothetical protein